MKFGLQPNDVIKIKSVFRKYVNIDKVLIYGSRVKGTYKDGSDIDLCLVGIDISLRQITDMLVEIDDLLLPYNVDLCDFNKLKNQELIEHIERVGEVFYNA